LTRAWFEFSCENIDKVNSNHTAMYLYLVDFFNYNKWPDKLGLPTDWTMQKLGIKNYKTYKKTLDDLISFNKIELVQKSYNNHTSNIIRLIEVVKNTKANTKAHTKASTKATAKADTISLLAYINIETINNKTIKLINENAELLNQCLESWINNHSQASNKDFEKAWELYGRKGNKKNSLAKWKNVSSDSFEKIIKHIPVYLNSVTEKKYIKDFEKYLSQEHWNSELQGLEAKKPQIEWVHYCGPGGTHIWNTREYFNKSQITYAPLGEIFEEIKSEMRDAD
jgi:hypothetical protein